MAENEVKEVKKEVTKTIMDLDTFKEITLVKPYTFTPVANTQEALARVQNDTAKFLELVNEGLRAEYQRELREQPDGWHTYDDEGEINGEFSGTIADPKAVNALVLILAKTVFSYSKEMKPEAKNAAKESAMGMIKASESIREGLKKSAALAASKSSE